MTLAVLVNSRPPADSDQCIASDDRAFHYGDGVFETMRVQGGQVRFLPSHLQRMFGSCDRLGLARPDQQRLLADIDSIVAGRDDAVLKLIVSCTAGGRGYRSAEDADVNTVLILYPAVAADTQPLVLRWCDTRLGRNSQLAGMKHLNRLEQVLAQREPQTSFTDEGLMLDTEGELVSATAGNVFLVRDGVLCTPDLRFCGVRGVMREQVLRAAESIGLRTEQAPLWPDDVAIASEVFITNAVRGIRPVRSLDELSWQQHPVATRLSGELGL